MTNEQKDWFEYGRLKAAWQIAKKFERGNERLLTPLVWEVRKKAYSWLKKGECYEPAYEKEQQ